MMDSIPRIISLRLWDCRKRPKISRWNVRILDELGGRDYSLVLDRSSENYTRNVRNHRPIVVRGVPQIIQVVIPYYIWLYMIYYTILVLKPMVTWGTTTLVPPHIFPNFIMPRPKSEPLQMPSSAGLWPVQLCRVSGFVFSIQSPRSAFAEFTKRVFWTWGAPKLDETYHDLWSFSRLKCFFGILADPIFGQIQIFQPPKR